MGEVLSALAEGLSVGAAVRIFGHGEFTIRAWLTRAGQHATALHERLFQNLKLWHVQLDEICTKTRQDADSLWVWLAVDARTKVIAVLKLGPRTQPTCPPQRSGVGMAHAVVHALVPMLAPNGLPVFTSDGLKLYFYALTAHFGRWVETVGRKTRPWQVRAEPLYGPLAPHLRWGQVSNTTVDAGWSALSAVPYSARWINSRHPSVLAEGQARSRRPSSSGSI